MSIGFAGPHHCMGLAHAVADNVFAEVLAACAARGDRLAHADIVALRQSYRDAAPERFCAIQSIYDTCMRAVAEEEPAVGDNEDGLLAMFLYAYTSRITRAVFQRTRKYLDKAWVERFYRAFARFVVQRIDPGFPERVRAVYIQASQDMGQRLSIGELVCSPAGQDAVRSCMRRLVIGSLSPQTVAEFCAASNEQQATAGNEAGGRMTFADAERFFLLLRYATPIRALLSLDGTGPAEPTEWVLVD